MNEISRWCKEEEAVTSSALSERRRKTCQSNKHCCGTTRETKSLLLSPDYFESHRRSVHNSIISYLAAISIQNFSFDIWCGGRRAAKRMLIVVFCSRNIICAANLYEWCLVESNKALNYGRHRVPSLMTLLCASHAATT